MAAVAETACTATSREASTHSQAFSKGLVMGGPGSGRKPDAIGAAQKRQIAEFAAIHGVRAAMLQFNVGENKVRSSLWLNKMYPARERLKRVGTSAIRILKRMLVDNETADVAAVAAGVTVTYARAVRLEAIAAGFIFQEKQCDTGHGIDAAEPNSGERGEGSAVG